MERDTVIQDGAILTIDSEFRDAVEDLRTNRKITRIQFESWCRSICRNWLPRSIQFSLKRIDRKSIYLTWVFTDEHDSIPQFSLSIFKALDYKIIEPKIGALDIFSVKEEILYPRELVLKTLILQNSKDHKSQYWCRGIMAKIETAMEHCSIVFYKP
jgi:hypothetical protein